MFLSFVNLDLFSHFEVEEREKNVENLDQLEVGIVRSVDRQEPVGILVDSSAVDKRTKMTAKDEGTLFLATTCTDC